MHTAAQERVVDRIACRRAGGESTRSPGRNAAVPTSELRVEIVALATLFPSPSNPRKNDDAVEHVAASIRRFGFQQPLVAKRSGEVIAGPLCQGSCRLR